MNVFHFFCFQCFKGKKSVFHFWQNNHFLAKPMWYSNYPHQNPSILTSLQQTNILSKTRETPTQKVSHFFHSNKKVLCLVWKHHNHVIWDSLSHLMKDFDKQTFQQKVECFPFFCFQCLKAKSHFFTFFKIIISLQCQCAIRTLQIKIHRFWFHLNKATFFRKTRETQGAKVSRFFHSNKKAIWLVWKHHNLVIWDSLSLLMKYFDKQTFQQKVECFPFFLFSVF